MGNILFGIDIAGLIDQEISPGLLSGTLTAIREGDRGADPTAGRTKTTTTHTFRGFIAPYEEDRIDGSTIRRGDKRVTLIGDSISPREVPQRGDKISIGDVDQDQDLNVIELVGRDPAAAHYIVQVRGVGS